MLSRMKAFWNTTFCDEAGNPKQGHEYQILHNMFGCAEIGVILRWHNGKLHDDGDLPAAEFQDTHTEHYRDGMLHNDGKPAIISEYGTQCEYYIDGKQEIP